MNLSKILLCFCLAIASLSSWAVDVLEFNCKRTEKGYTEEYEMKMTLASGTQKAKIFLDDRDLDQSDMYGTQVVKSITLARPNILILIEANFQPEEIMGVSYPAGNVIKIACRTLPEITWFCSHITFESPIGASIKENGTDLAY